MLFSAHHIPYQQTGLFSRIVLDYLDDVPELRPFYTFRPTIEGFGETIHQKQQQSVNRTVLVDVLQQQYESVAFSDKVNGNIQALLSENTFTVCTAHQPNLFTGPLYFIYKILHAIRLADHLKQQWPEYNFVPVYYMGSEDADLAELNHFHIDGKRYEWKTKQSGAVGRMKVDGLLLDLIQEMEGQLVVYPHGKEFIEIIRQCFQKGVSIQHATFQMVHQLFNDFGLVVLIPDNAELKRSMRSVFADDLFHQTPSAIVSESSENLSKKYNAQAYPREINLFYLKEDIRERIVRTEEGFTVHQADISFTDQEIETELDNHPERFSPNVILRGVFQETILPNIAFIGGGGELAYWLQLKALFDHYHIVFPVLVLRNSFMMIEPKWMDKMNKLGFSPVDIFMAEADLLNMLVLKSTEQSLSLNGSFSKAEQVYEEIKQQALTVDSTLGPHVAAIKTQSLKLLKELEKKMLRAEKKKFAAEERQIKMIKNQLFPNSGLQERYDNIGYWFAVYGKDLLHKLYHFSLTIEQQFTILLKEK